MAILAKTGPTSLWIEGGTQDNYGNTYDANGRLVDENYYNDVYIPQQQAAAEAIKRQEFENLKTTDPNAYYTQQAQNLADTLFAAYANTSYGATGDIQKELAAIKDINPTAYYKAQLGLLSKQMGWQHGQSTSQNNRENEELIKSMLPEMQNAGLSIDQINSIINSNFSQASSQNQQRIANEAIKDKVGKNYIVPASIIAGGLATAYFAPAAAAGEAAGAGALETSGASGLTGGGAFTPSVGSGASFTLDPAATYSAIGSTPSAVGSSGFGLNAGAPAVGAYSPSGAAATQSSLGLGYNPVGLQTSSIGMGGTTGAGSLTGIAGSEAAAGLGGANLGTGLTAEQLARYEGGISQPSSQASKLSDLLKKGMGSNLTNAMQNFATGQTGVGQQIPGIIRGNQNPFVMTQNQPIQNTKLDLSALAELLKQG